MSTLMRFISFANSFCPVFPNLLACDLSKSSACYPLSQFVNLFFLSNFNKTGWLETHCKQVAGLCTQVTKHASTFKAHWGGEVKGRARQKLISGSKKIPISDKSDEIIKIQSLDCCHQVLVTEICNGGRIPHIITNFIPNIRALNRKHFTY